MDPTTVSAGLLITKIIADALKSFSGPIKQLLSENKAKSKISAIARSLASYENVKTITNPEKALKISEFYLAPAFAYSNGRPFEVKKIEDFGIEDHPLIEGIAGQGKSMFMRHIFIEEIKKSERLPILIELRRISDENSLQDLIEQQLAAVKMPAPKELWPYLAENNLAILLLDGFDELTESLRLDFISQVERLTLKYSKLKIAITSRPDAAIRGASFLRTVTMQRLDKKGQNEIVKKICDAETAKGLIKALEVNAELASMVDTPMFASLLCVAYISQQHLPETIFEFYNLVFETLLYRHDSHKQGYSRPRKSGLGNQQFSRVFESFCFLTSKEQVLRLTDALATDYISKALKSEQLGIDIADKYFSDLVKITCLLVKDGLDYQFLHKSIQEYFCARYIARLTDDTARTLYKKLLESPIKVRQLSNAIRFLDSIDTYRYTTFFELPALSKLLTDSYDYDGKLADIVYSYNIILRMTGLEQCVITLIGGSGMSFQTLEVSKIHSALVDYFQFQRSVLHAVHDFLRKHENFSLIQELPIDPEATAVHPTKTEDEKSNPYFLHKIIDQLNACNEFEKYINDLRFIKSLKAKIKGKLDFVEKFDENNNLLDI